MSSNDSRGTRSKNSAAMAAYMKSKGITRTTGQCPVCHRPVAVGGTPLLNHFNTNCR